MATITPPYFFDEFLLPTRRKQPTPREHALGFTVKDLDWLHTLYYATHTARTDLTLQRYPMRVERLLINAPGQAALPMAGAFMMSPTPDDHKAVLYTPYDGLELFESRTALLSEVQERLKQPSSRTDLLQFLSIAERDALPVTVHLTVTASVIEGAVMEDQKNTVLASQQKNAVALLDELRKFPSLNGMLDTLLSIMARPYFPGLNQADTRVNFFSRASVGEHSRWVDSLPLRDALLRFYVSHAWPAGQTHSFFNIGHDTRAFTQAQLADDLQRWDSVIEQTSGILSTLLNSLLQTYWNEDFNAGQSRRQFCARVMSDKCRTDLLFKHQDRVLSTDESQKLRALFLPDHASRTAFAGPLNIEKVRVHAPFQHYVELGGTLMISNAQAYLYTQSRGLQVLENLNDLKDILLTMLKTAGHEDELLNFLSLDERSVFIGMDHIEVTGNPVAGDLFLEMVEDILAKQFDNLEYALGLFRRSAGEIDLDALLDSALDVRTMLDSRLMALETDGRWSVHPITLGNGRPSTVHAEKAKAHLQRLQAVEAAMALERSKQPTLRDLVAHALDAELAKRRLNLNADDVYINTYATHASDREERLPQRSSSMVEHFIARLAKQAIALTDSSLSGFYGRRSAGVANKLQNLTTAGFNAVIEQVLTTFAERDLRGLPHLFLDNNRAHLSDAMLQGLSGEARLRRLDKSLSPPGLALLDSVLHANSLTRLTRRGLNGFIPDAFGLTLKIGTDTIPQALANCFVLTERGGIDPDHSGAALLWTPRCGYEAFASIKVLCEALKQRLHDPFGRLPLMENLPVSRRAPHQACQLGPLRRIDDHLLDNRQQSYSDFMRDAIDHLLSMKLSARRFQDCMDSFIRRAPPSNLPRAIAIARAMVRQQALPVWLGMAQPQEQLLQAELLEQYRVNSADERDYLHGITPMRELAKSTLSTLLDARFAGQIVNPDTVLIPGRIDLEGHAETLTDFALRHLPDLRAEDIRPQSRTATPLPAALDGNAVVQLVRQLDLKSLYQTRLTTRLKGQTEDARERRQLFCRQLPWQLLQYAHEQTLQERLSASAWSFVQQIFDMPDAVARAAVAGATAIIRPLELIATAGAAQVKALGCYLIGPKAGASGPLILYAPYSPKHLLKEYANEAALLNEFTTAGALQDWVIGQMPAPHQATYRNLLGQRWSQGHSEIRLDASPITGNLLSQLFEDNLEMLLQMLASQFSPSGKVQWSAVTSLFTEDIPKGLQFMAGKLAYPLAVWRSHKLFLASAEDLQRHRWQHALKTFVGGVAELASLRKALDKLVPQTASTEEQIPLEQWLQAPAPAAATLADLDLTAPARTQLQAFENHAIALKDLEQDTQSGLYRDKTGSGHFVPLAGKVYPVKKAGEHWRVSNDELHGPYVQRNAQGAWTLDLGRHHPRYGKTLSRYAGRAKTRAAERDTINIEAVGMRKIAALSSWKAQCIDEALNVATYYAVTCKRNLLHFATHLKPNSRPGRFFSELFGVVTLTSDQVQRVERRVDEVLDELTNHTLISPDSRRFVSGTRRYSQQDTFAFVLPDDAEQKIYLLDRFFDPHMDIYQNRLNTPFNLSAHARATVLIHEITHIKSLTEDLAYLDTMRPFHDLINVKICGAQLMQTDLGNLRDTALSTLTPATLLFKTWDEFTQEWEDFGSSHVTSDLKDKVLSTTGCRTLDDARSMFMSNADKRIDTILANADSVTYLISQLGRELDAGA
ncbi:dermonecrotic toxin domain-containing protein [Pseudomonas sp. BR20]|uniref:dermonecrotic toxin domain-containing protein n=1 Tax=Pseudomonas sp. BR20 TaxID=3137452 RepID=UPI003D6E2616